MNRGTRVAQAYIALTADGSNIDDDIADAFDEVDWDELGERTSKKYSKALQKNLEKDLGQTFEKTISKHHGRVAKAIARDDVMRTTVRDMVDKAHNNSSLDDLYRHVARRAGGEYSGEFGKTVERLVKRDLRDALYRASQQPGVRDNLDSILSRYSSSPEGRGETIYQLGPVVESSIRKAEKVLKDSYRRQTEEYVAFWEDALKEREQDERAMTRRLARFGEAQDRFAAEGKRQLALQRERDERGVTQRLADFGEAQDRFAAEGKRQLALIRERDERDMLQRLADFGAAQDRFAHEGKRQLALIRERDERDRLQRLAAFGAAQDRFAAEGHRQLALIRERDERDRLTRQMNLEKANDQLVFDAKKRLYEQDQFEERSVRAAREAAQILSGIRIDPRIDRRAVERTRRELQRLLMDREGLQVRLSDVSPADRLRIERQIEAIDGKIEVYADHDRLRRSLLVAEGLIDRSGRRIVRRSLAYYQGRDMADRLGRLTGMGARNNFLNIVGRTIRMVTNLSFSAIRGVSRLTRGALEMGKAFQTGFQSAAQGASLFSRAGSGMAAVGARLAPMFASMAAGLPALAAGIVALAVALVALTFISSVLVSTISALLGVVFALAGTLVSGLTAALMVGGAAFVPVIAAAGLLTTAFMSMNDAQKKYMAETFTPLREGFVGIGQIILEELIPAFETWSLNLQRFGAMVIPLARTIGQSFADAGNTITAALTGPGFQNLTVALGQHLPQIVRSLSSALGDFLNGLSGVFAALMPFVERFAEYLARVAERFSKWANSAEGQNSIVDFTERAWESLKSLWNFMREFFGWLRDIFFNPTVQEFGNKMFDGLARSFRRLRDNIKDGSLEKWMQNAEKFGRALWGAMTALWDIFKTLNNSTVISMVSAAFDVLGWVFRRVNNILQGFIDLMNGKLPDSLEGKALMLNPLISALTTVKWLVEKVIEGFKLLSETEFKMPGLLGRGLDLLGLSPSGGGFLNIGGGGNTPFADGLIDPRTQHNLDNANRTPTWEWPDLDDLFNFDWPKVRGSGRDTISNTDLPDPKKQSVTFTWINPYKEWAESLINEGPTITQQINKALKEMGKEINKALNEVLTADSGKEARQALTNIRKNLRQQGRDLVDLAQSSLNTAAQSLANVTDPADLPAALAEVRRAQTALKNAQLAQKRLNKVAKQLNQQRRINSANVRALVNGEQVTGATLAEYARARERLAVKIEKANEKLSEAIATRNQYAEQVAQSVRTFGSLMTAQAQEIDGVQQALTHQDITKNLEDRLAQIRSFQRNLNQLRAMGLSDLAYKELLDAGVEQGSEFAAALLEGGVGAIDSVNSTTAAIEQAAESMGLDASRYLYQAGVDAAQGLVDGLMAADSRVESAAKHLGEVILSGIQFSLGIASPAKRLIDEMDHVGDGTVIGLRNQSGKVRTASAELAELILRGTTAGPVQAASDAATAAPVSGNSAEHHWHITTPSENPRTVALEMMNEVVGRL